MTIVRAGGANLARQPEAGTLAKAAKHAVKKHAAKKHAAKHAAKHSAKHAAKHAAKAAKHAAKHAAKGAHHAFDARKLEDSGAPYLVWDEDHDEAELTKAFHHLQRAGAVISLLEGETGKDLRGLLEHGIELYRGASARGRAKISARCASGLLRAAEHLGMAGLYAARSQHRVEVEAPSRMEVAHHLEALGPRLNKVWASARGKRMVAMTRELLRRAEESGDDPHLEYELTMSAEGICSALEAGL